jgi:hypothetical protein
MTSSPHRIATRDVGPIQQPASWQRQTSAPKEAATALKAVRETEKSTTRLKSPLRQPQALERSSGSRRRAATRSRRRKPTKAAVNRSASVAGARRVAR